MMIEKIYLALILIFFILAFAIRNIKTYLVTKKSIKGKSLKLTLSILISTTIYILILARIVILKPSWILEFDLSHLLYLKFMGYLLVFVGFVVGILALKAMRNSWRVGIKYDQKTELIDTGIYGISRNPYFLSYEVLMLGYICIFSSIILFVLLCALTLIFHKMILEEEDYLLSVHGDKYADYLKKVNRYLTF